MTVLEKLQAEARKLGVAGLIEKRLNGYFLLREGYEPRWLGWYRDVLANLRWEAEAQERERWADLGLERYGLDWTEEDLYQHRLDEDEEWRRWAEEVWVEIPEQIPN